MPPLTIWFGWTSGEVTSTSPTFDSAVQPEFGSRVADSYSASLQALRPSATEGLVVKPCGRLTTAFFIWLWARPVPLVRPSSSKLMSKPRPVGEVAAFEVGSEAMCGSKGSWLQAVSEKGSAPSKAAKAWAGWPRLDHDSPSALVAKGTAQLVGRVRKAAGFSWFSGSQSRFRPASFDQ